MEQTYTLIPLEPSPLHIVFLSNEMHNRKSFPTPHHTTANNTGAHSLTMCILAKDQLTNLIERYRIIYPYDHNLLDGDGYVLTVKEETTLHYLEHQNITSYEIVFTPPHLVAHLTAKSKYGRMGLSFLNAAKVHSGFIGRLALEIVNLSNDRKPITIKRGDPFMHIEFITRQGEPSPYTGPYQFQYLTQEEKQMYIPILRKVFPNYEELAQKWQQNKPLK